MPIIINNQEDIKKMRVAGKLASEVLDFITPLIEPNITTDKIDTLCHEFMTKKQGTIPAPLCVDIVLLLADYRHFWWVL